MLKKSAELHSMYLNKPIIGIAGGIGSGKTHLARLLGEMGCCVIESDQQVRDAYRDAAVREQLRQWWGDEAFMPDGEANRSIIAAKIFASPAEKRRLEQLLHPLVAEAREARMKQFASDPKVLAFVWDTPLLFETGLDRSCDAIVFVDTELLERQRRVQVTRGWLSGQLEAREILQWPLDKKRASSHYVLTNTADADEFRRQAQNTLSRIIERSRQPSADRS